MKQKKLLILFAASALFAACSSDEGPTAPEKQAAQSGEVPVAFDTYVNRGTTRAGASGPINDDATLQGAGFGVFAYYTNADNYDQTFTPNFMYNEPLTYTKDTNEDSAPDAWEYAPIKYWPNEFGEKSLSDDVDKVSFFAYAPYVSVTNYSSGKVADNTYGIAGMKGNTATGDPMVKYISSFYTDKQVDLLWGTVANETDYISWAIKNSDTKQSLTAGKPYKDVQHPKGTAYNQTVKFDFKHSLASLNVTVDTKANSTSVNDPDGNTKVFIRSVTFEGFDTKGALNLNNETANVALWYNFDCENELNNGSEVTIKDGRKDGKEGVTPATKEYAAINPKFVQGVWTDVNHPGVTGTADNLFAQYNNGVDFLTPTNPSDPIFVIPNGDKLKVTIEYDVLTKDLDLVGKLNDGVTNGSVVKNVITRYITKASAGTAGQVTIPADADALILENGYKYTINLHLGLNSVEFNATVAGWGLDSGNPYPGGADLPHNNVAP